MQIPKRPHPARLNAGRQPEVCLAIKNLNDRGWIKISERTSVNGRPSKVYKLALSSSKIRNIIEKEKKEEMKNQLARLRKMKENIG